MHKQNASNPLAYQAAYVAAFSKVYPAKKAEILPSGKPGLFRIAIDGDKGDMQFSKSDIIEATKEFSRQGR